MSKEDIIRHWEKGSRDALEAAQALHDLEKYALALFDCHLAVEKSLKALYITQEDKDAPPTHNLLLLAKTLNRSWSEEQLQILNDLTDYAVAARYDDPEWAKSQATKDNSHRWIKIVQLFLSELQ